MADLAIEMAFNPKPQREEQRWARFVDAGDRTATVV
jgi:hypothetical protein